jgi:hypothetical protein
MNYWGIVAEVKVTKAATGPKNPFRVEFHLK